MIFVFDIDGTICFDGVRIPKRIEEQLKRLLQKDHKIVFASARPIRDMLPLLGGDLKTQLLIGGNGSIVSEHSVIQVQNYIPTAEYERLKSFIKKYDIDYLMDGDWNYSKRIRTVSAIESKIDPGHLAANVPMEAINNCIKMILLNMKKETYRTVKDRLAQENLEIIEHSEELNIDITAKGINKYETLKKFIGEQDYICFGNDHNDIELMRHAKYSVCVGNHSSVSLLADKTLSANERFITEEIHRLLLEGNTPHERRTVVCLCCMSNTDAITYPI